VPVDWCPLASLPADGAQSQAFRANLRLLNALNILEEVPQDLEQTAPGLTETLHLEAKLDLILGMLGELLYQQAEIPEVLTVTVSAHGVSIADTLALPIPAVGKLLRIRLFLDSRYPQALVLYGSVSATTKTGFSLEIDELSEPLQEQLDKLVFRQHRRAIASSRREQET